MTIERLRGHATIEGTRRGAESFDAGARTLGRTGLTVAPVGFGSHRVGVGSPLHRRALADALRGGANLVDTSTSYTDGGSEALVGTVLANMVQQGELRREHVVVVSKVGYIQGSNLARIATQPDPDPYPDIVRYRDECWHCIHPEFIADQLEGSLDRLGLERIDVLLLHDPECFLLHAAGSGVLDDGLREVYDDRLRGAFVQLEALVKTGRIAWYGVSSNGFVVPPDDPSFTSVDRLLELATEAAGSDHHLAVVQMPMNLLELGAALQRHETPRGPRTALEIATEADLGVMINRPLDAFVQRPGGPALVRLANPSASDTPAQMATARDALAQVRKLEGQWATGLGKQLVTEDGADNAVDLFRWGQELATALDEIRDLEQWRHLRHDMLAPHLGKTSAALLDALEGEAREAFGAWWTRYGAALHEAFAAIETGLKSRRVTVTRRISQRLDPLLPAPWRALPLTQKAVLTLLSAPVSTVLVGMRQPGYVADILTLREHPVRLLSAATGPVSLSRVCDAMTEAVAQ